MSEPVILPVCMNPRNSKSGVSNTEREAYRPESSSCIVMLTYSAKRATLHSTWPKRTLQTEF